MSTRTLLALLGALLATLSLSVAAAPPLLSPADLEERLSDPLVRVIDIREAKYFPSGHVPGAVSAPYAQWRGPASNPGELPEVAKLTELLQGLGLRPDNHAVVVSSGADATDFGSAARVYWTLKVAGIRQLSILNGGYRAWVADGQEIRYGPATVERSDFKPVLERSLIASRDEVAQAIEARKALLLDARPAGFFRGESRHASAKLAGTLPGASNLPHDRWFKPGTGRFVSTDEARSIAAALRLEPGRDTLAFCNTGHWAATNWFAMSEVIGQPQVKLYAGSMVDWTSAPKALPVEGPGRVGQLLVDLRIWTARAFN
jgi:thiosulfate/3-mercaptopyruvate sulfurtransferase